MTVNPKALPCSKADFCAALAAEGIPVNPSYRHIPCEEPWFKNKNTFGKSGFPWNCTDYKGPKDPQYSIVNAIQAAETNFNISVHENYTDQDTQDIIDAINKVLAGI